MPPRTAARRSPSRRENPRSPTPAPCALRQHFAKWEAEKLASPGASALVLSVGHIKGLSEKPVKGKGSARFDLESGAFAVELEKLAPGAYELLLLDNSATGSSLGVDAADQTVTLATFTATGEPVTLAGELPEEIKGQFRLDFVVVRRLDSGETKDVLIGSPRMFDKAYFSSTKADLPWADFVPALTQVAGSDSSTFEALIADGERLFLEETFNGNGRTCNTCHRPENNFTIDAAFIATLPPSDPLFVAETNPELAQLEKPALMRQFGLILENVDGLEDPANRFVMRSVPHTLALPTSLRQDTTIPNPPAQMLGWSGDGSAGTGTLREFAIGAVVQHATKRLVRQEGVDFRLPTDAELDAMEAFQLSLGRQADLDLAAIAFKDPTAAQGRDIFLNGNGSPDAGGRCQTCHVNAGASAGAALTNRNFDTGVEDVPHPARAVQDFPRDGGFGKDADGQGGFGDGEFNSTPLIEAVDTPPFFHNNLVNTTEEAVAFYNSPAFNAARAPAARIQLSASERKAVAAMLRVLNALENARTADSYAARGMSPSAGDISKVAGLAGEETRDAIAALKDGSLHAEAVKALEKAAQEFAQATDTRKKVMALKKGRKELGKARADLVAE